MGAFVEYTEPLWRNLNMRQLSVDEAYVSATSQHKKTAFLYTLTDECYTCPFTRENITLLPVHLIGKGGKTMNVLRMNVAHAWNFKVLASDAGPYVSDNKTALCEFRQMQLREFGVYNLTLHSNETCSFVVDKSGVNVYLSLLSALVLLVFMVSLLKLLQYAWRSYNYDEVAQSAAAAISQLDESVADTNRPRKRLRSLDTFRGLAVIFMIFCNSGGGHYWWMEHSPWNGLHVADVVFPSFLWIMGACIPLSMRTQLSRGTTKWKIGQRIIWRSMKLFIIGICLNSINAPQLEKLRIMGVLQRFAIAFLVCGLLNVVFARKDLFIPQQTWKRITLDLRLLRRELLVALLFICISLGIMFGLRVPDCPKGYLGPGGKHANATYSKCIGGAAGYIDVQILGSDHIYRKSSAMPIYNSPAFDPEGVFGCLLTIVQVILGVLAGTILLTYKDTTSHIWRWLVWAALLALVGGSLCSFSQEGGLIPINKNLWSLSFVFVTSALAFVLLSVLYFVIDVRHWWTGYPFEECGKNAILMYIGHTVAHKMLPWHWRIGKMNTHFILLLESLWNTMLWLIIALQLSAKKFYYNL